MHPFRAAVEAADMDRAIALLADDVVFRSPVVYRPYHGRDAVAPVLRAVGRVLKDIRYVREFAGADAGSHALVFEARVGDRTIEGCDFIHTRDDGAVDELVVMMRPLSGLVAVAEAMRAELTG